MVSNDQLGWFCRHPLTNFSPYLLQSSHQNAVLLKGQSHEMDQAVVGMMNSSGPSEVPGLIVEVFFCASLIYKKLYNILQISWRRSIYLGDFFNLFGVPPAGDSQVYSTVTHLQILQPIGNKPG